MDPPSLYKEFNEALQQEMEYIQQSGGDSKSILRNGKSDVLMMYNAVDKQDCLSKSSGVEA